MIKKYSYSKDKDIKISKNFVLKEHIAGTSPLRKLYENGIYDELYLDTDIYNKFAQPVRDHFGKSVIISSGYRPKDYNRSVNGATASRHMDGTAIDLYINGIEPIDIAKFLEKELNCKGIGLYTAHGFVHADLRNSKYLWINSGNGINKAVNTFLNL